MENLNPDQFMALRFECEAELARLKLNWRSPRCKAYYRAVTGLPDAILADVPQLAIAGLLVKLRKEPTPVPEFEASLIEMALAIAGLSIRLPKEPTQ